MLELTCAVLVSMGVYLILEGVLIRKVFGIIVLSTGINLILLLCGRLSSNHPALIQSIHSNDFSNPLPQALILTAIVIGFGIISFLIVSIRTSFLNKSIPKEK